MSASINVLIVEDEIKLLNHLEEKMKSEGFTIIKCSSYSELQTRLDERPMLDVIVLDRLLNGQDSANLVEEIKVSLPDVKIMVLSAINTASEKTALLDQGVDDYLSKPFDMDELTARIRALSRRNAKELVFGNINLNLENRTAKVNGQDVMFQNKEFVLLKTLLKTPGKIFNKKYLYEHVWEMSGDVESNTVETAVNKLRRRLEEAGASVKIKSLRFKGYWIEE